MCSHTSQFLDSEWKTKTLDYPDFKNGKLLAKNLTLLNLNAPYRLLLRGFSFHENIWEL